MNLYGEFRADFSNNRNSDDSNTHLQAYLDSSEPSLDGRGGEGRNANNWTVSRSSILISMVPSSKKLGSAVSDSSLLSMSLKGRPSAIR